jgi:micrococcal nuclease
MFLKNKIFSLFSLPKWHKKNTVDIKWEDTVEFTFPISEGYVIKVYDGDTITIATKFPYSNSPLYRINVRLKGIDTPEIKGKDISDDEKEAAKNARDFLDSLILHKMVKLKNIQPEKYGRLLADVYISDIYVNQLLVQERFAVSYSGKTKIKPKCWLIYKITGEF